MARRHSSQKKTRPPTPSDPASARFDFAMHAVFAGSQSKMAAGLKCSQSFISRIVVGNKEPGAKLLSSLAEHPMINSKWALTGEGEPLRESPKGLPVAECLLPSPPKNHAELLTGKYDRPDVEFAQDLYILIINASMRIVGDASERLRTGDHVVVDTNAKNWRVNLRQLHKRLCAVRHQTNAGVTIDLRRVFFLEDVEGREAQLVTLARPAKDDSQTERERVVALDLDSFLNETQSKEWQRIDVECIVGFVRLVYWIE